MRRRAPALVVRVIGSLVGFVAFVAIVAAMMSCASSSPCSGSSCVCSYEAYAYEPAAMCVDGPWQPVSDLCVQEGRGTSSNMMCGRSPSGQMYLFSISQDSKPYASGWTFGPRFFAADHGLALLSDADESLCEKAGSMFLEPVSIPKCNDGGGAMDAAATDAAATDAGPDAFVSEQVT